MFGYWQLWFIYWNCCMYILVWFGGGMAQNLFIHCICLYIFLHLFIWHIVPLIWLGIMCHGNVHYYYFCLESCRQLIAVLLHVLQHYFYILSDAIFLSWKILIMYSVMLFLSWKLPTAGSCVLHVLLLMRVAACTCLDSCVWCILFKQLL